MDSGNKETKYQEGIILYNEEVSTEKTEEREIIKKGLEPFLDSFLSQVANQTPAGECGVEEFLFHIKGAKMTQEDHQIRLAILLPVQGDAQEFIKFIGADIPLEKIMQHLRDRYWRKERVGDLWNEFCELQQRNGEMIEQFIERIETFYRHIKPSLGRGVEDDTILHKRLLKGMLPTLRNSICNRLLCIFA